MNFLNPNALWLLLAVPVLILVYILKTQHEERRISSTFIWKRSEKLIKKKLPWQILRRSILFILQLLTVVLIALIASRPTMTIKGKGEEWILIVDGSASMQITTDGSSRFERAVDEATKVASDMRYGNKATVIYTGDATSYMINRSDSSADVVNALEALTCSDSTSDFTAALELARLIQEQNEYAKIIFYTDKNHEDVSDVTVVNVALENEWNVTAKSLSVVEDGGATVFMSDIISYGQDAPVTAALYVDGKLIDAKQIDCKADEMKNTYWTNTGVKSFSTAELFVEAEDGYAADNSFILCQNRENKKNVMLISENPTYLQMLLSSFSSYSVKTYNTMEDAYISQSTADNVAVILSGFDLYIFDGCCPDILPNDGTSWIFNADAFPESMELTRVTEGNAILTPETEGVSEKDVGKVIGGYLSFGADDESEAYRKLTEYYNAGNIAVRVLYPYDNYSNYRTIMKCGDLPAMLVPKDGDSRYIVFSFDIHDSNLPMLVDYAELFMDMENYCYPAMMEEWEYSIGDTVAVTRLPKAEYVRLTYPNGDKTTLTPVMAPRPFAVSTAGLYTLTQDVKNGRSTVVKGCNFFVHVPFTESSTSLDGGSLVTADDIGAPDVGEGSGAIEIWMYLALALLLVMMIEWWLYYAGQY